MIDLLVSPARVSGVSRGISDADAPSARPGQWAEDFAKHGRSTRRSTAFVEASNRLDLSTLKCRPLEVVLAALAGDTNGEIARSLRISRSTVKYHVSRLIKHRAVLLRSSNKSCPPKPEPQGR